MSGVELDRDIDNPRFVDYKDLVSEFHKVFYNAAEKGLTWGGATYLGIKIWKSPLDLQLYQELIWDLKPHLIVETGTAFGGSALYFAHLLDALSYGKVLSIDIQEVANGYPKHPRIAYVGGRSSIDPETLREVGGWFAANGCLPKVAGGLGHPTLIILDSDHSKQHVLRELEAYSHFVPPGSWLVVEDTNVGPNDIVYPEHGPGPGDALRSWLPKHPDFVPDEARAGKYLFSMHTWLRRRRT